MPYQRGGRQWSWWKHPFSTTEQEQQEQQEQKQEYEQEQQLQQLQQTTPQSCAPCNRLSIGCCHKHGLLFILQLPSTT